LKLSICIYQNFVAVVRLFFPDDEKVYDGKAFSGPAVVAEVGFA
jgi:hypothetical protein